MLGAGKMTVESTVSTLLFDEQPVGCPRGHAEMANFPGHTGCMRFAHRGEPTPGYGCGQHGHDDRIPGTSQFCRQLAKYTALGPRSFGRDSLRMHVKASIHGAAHGLNAKPIGLLVTRVVPLDHGHRRFELEGKTPPCSISGHESIMVATQTRSRRVLHFSTSIPFRSRLSRNSLHARMNRESVRGRR
jgi:hypothetical protein